MALIECKNLCLSISGRELLKDINFSLDAGINVIAGENGSGKSLLLKCMMSFIKAYTGDVLIDGVSTRTIKNSIYRFSFIPTDARSAVIGESALDDVMFSLGKKNLENENKAIEALRFCDAEELSDKRIDNMSTGELRRVNIASQWVMDRDIILMDEPFTGLDYSGSLALIELMLKLKSMHKNIVVVSHDLDRFLKFTDMLIVLREGRVVSIGKPAELLSQLEPNNIHRPRGSIDEMGWM